MEPESIQILDEEQASQPIQVRAKQDDRPALLLSFVDKKEKLVGNLSVQVVWCPKDQGKKNEQWLKAGPEGRLRVPCTPDCDADFEVRPAGRHFARKSWNEPQPECPREKKVVLDEGVFLEGRLVDKWRKPVPGVTITTVGTHFHGMTDSEGKFSIGPLDKDLITLVRGGKEADSSLAGMILARRNVRQEERPFPVELDIPKKGNPPFLELELVQGGSICLAVEAGGQDRVLLQALGVFFDPSAQKPVFSSFRTQSPAETKDPARLCTGLFPAGKYYLEIGWLGPGFLKVWWPGVVRREEATPVGVKAGSVLELGPLRVIPSGSIALVPPSEAIVTKEHEGEVTFELKEVFLDEEGRELPAGERPPQWEEQPPDLVAWMEEWNEKGPPAKKVGLHGVAEGTYRLRLLRTVPGQKEPLIWEAIDPVEVKVGKWSTARELKKKETPPPLKGVMRQPGSCPVKTPVALNAPGRPRSGAG